MVQPERQKPCLARAVLEADPEGRTFEWLNWHFSGYDRRQHDQPAT